MNKCERDLWAFRLTEKIGMHHNIDSKDIHEFAKLVQTFKPNEINISIKELPVDAYGKQYPEEEYADYLIYTSVFSFPIGLDKKSLAKYTEKYDQSRICIPTNLRAIDEMVSRSLVTANNRLSQLQAELAPQIIVPTYSFSTYDSGLGIRTPEEIERVRKNAITNRLAPFII